MSRVRSRTLAASMLAVAAMGGALFLGVGTANAATNDITLPSISLNCQVQVTADADLHVRPDLSSPIGARVTAGTTLTVVGTTIGADAALWLRLDNGLYVRASLTADVNCGLSV
ncbi:hypothetical protein [Micromonospora sp. NPDC048830]|uniref:hypothetical protein n=1 Tax=Micromonospora sp. NPDC048830 TaxID=3364257 RepID=UPI00371CE4AD